MDAFEQASGFFFFSSLVVLFVVLPYLSRGEVGDEGKERNRSWRSQKREKARQTAALVSMGISVKRLIVI